MAYQAASTFKLDLDESIMVGKDSIDREFTRRAGIGRYFSIEEFISRA